MALIIETNNPTGLLTAIKKAIDAKSIETWSYDGDGDFTHTPDQWKNKAWLRPKVYQGELRFGILGRNDVALSKLIYAVYHGRFSEMLLNHFDNDFTKVRATALPIDIDVIPKPKAQ